MYSQRNAFKSFFKKGLGGKSKWSAALVQYISTALNLSYNKTNYIKLKATDPEICLILIF